MNFGQLQFLSSLIKCRESWWFQFNGNFKSWCFQFNGNFNCACLAETIQHSDTRFLVAVSHLVVPFWVKSPLSRGVQYAWSGRWQVAGGRSRLTGGEMGDRRTALAGTWITCTLCWVAHEAHLQRIEQLVHTLEWHAQAAASLVAFEPLMWLVFRFVDSILVPPPLLSLFLFPLRNSM